MKEKKRQNIVSDDELNKSKVGSKLCVPKRNKLRKIYAPSGMSNSASENL